MTCFGDYLVDAAKADLGQGDIYGPSGVAFCSLAVQRWLQTAAARAHLARPPIAGSGSSLATMRQLQAINTWLPAARVRSTPSLIKAGQIAVWEREGSDSGLGHIAVVTGGVAANHFLTIEANAGPVVAAYNRDLNATTLLGVGYFPDCPPTSVARDAVVALSIVAVAGGVAWALREGHIPHPLKGHR